MSVGDIAFVFFGITLLLFLLVLWLYGIGVDLWIYTQHVPNPCRRFLGLPSREQQEEPSDRKK